MRITKIILDGFNGQQAEYDLDPKSLFVGRRGAGKSTVLSAIDYVLNRIPPNQSWPLHSNPSDESQKSFSVTLVLDDGNIIKRETKLTKTGCVGSLWTGPADNPAKMSANSEALAQFPITISSAESFLSISNNKKMELLFKLFAKTLKLEENPDTLATSIDNLEKKINAEVAEHKTAVIAAEQVEAKAKEIAGTPDDVTAIENELAQHNEMLAQARIELKRLRDAEQEAMTQKRIEADRLRVAEEQRKKQEAENAKPVVPPVAFVPPINVGVATQDRETGNLPDSRNTFALEGSGPSMIVSPVIPVERVAVPPTIDVVAEIDKVVALAVEKTVCHNCNATQMANSVLIPLKILAKKIKEARS